MTMKENQNGNSFDSISFGKETDSQTFGCKDRYELNDSRMDADLTGLEAEDTDHVSIIKVTDDSSMDNENGTMVSPKKAGQNGLSHNLCMDNENETSASPGKESKDGLLHQLSNWDKDIDSLSSDSSDIDKEQRSSEHESLDTLEESAECIQIDSSAPLFTDKNVLECALPDLEVCYKEINCQDLKDICVDEWRHEIDVNVIESCVDGQPGSLFPQPHNIDHFEADKDSSLDPKSLTADQYGNREENYDKTLVSQERLDSCLDNSFEIDTAEQHGDPENVAETSDIYFDATDEADIDSSDRESLVDRNLPIEDFSTHSSLGTDGGNKLMHVPDQVLTQEAVPENPAVSSAQTRGARNDRSITSNISPLEGVVAGNDMAEDVEEQSACTGDMRKNLNAENLPDVGVGDCHGQSLVSKEDFEEQSADNGDVHENVNAENLPDAREEKSQCTRNREGDYSLGQSVISTKMNSDGDSATRYDQCVRSKGSSCENAHEVFPDHKQEDSGDVPTDDAAETPSNSSPGSTNDSLVERITPNDDGRNRGDIPVVSHLQHDMGETSFSAASVITYSGPIAFSGSLSHRSDGSTTSGKSFAFPILPSEWNSSPVRMAKADRRHKGWRSGLLCCRF